MRIAGQYKDHEVKVDILCVRPTYERYILIGCEGLKTVNAKIIDLHIGEMVRQLFGPNRPSYICDAKMMSPAAKLPEETGYAWCACDLPIEKGDGSYLILVWFQDSKQDPFAVLKERLKNVDWENEASDFYY